MNKLLLKTFNNRRIFLIGCSNYYDMIEKKRQIRKAMEGKGDVEFIYACVPGKLKPYMAERVVDMHPNIGSYAGGEFKNYLNLNKISRLNAVESFASAVQLCKQQFNPEIEYVLIVQG